MLFRSIINIVALLIVPVIAHVYPDKTPAAAETHAHAAVQAPAAVAATAQLYFGVGEATLSAENKAKLAEFAATAKKDESKQIIVSGYHDATGDAAKNAELAKQRALAVSDELKAQGVAGERVTLKKPEELVGAANADEARRVDVSL